MSPGDSPTLTGQRLAAKFRAQQQFSRGYSPLYERLFGIVAGWLEDMNGADEALATWLAEAGAQRRSLDVTLLLMAGLHRDVLSGCREAAELRPFFPTVGGQESPDSAELEPALRQVIATRREVLTDLIRTGDVQTNETGRGLCWLLPLALTGWSAVRLVDLGASAGLNLVAEQRAYRLLDAANRATLLDVGLGQPIQFQTQCDGTRPDFSGVDGRALPFIVARDGCDQAPFRLDSRQDELTLMAFIWGDQPHRLERLREGIAALKAVQESAAPVRLGAAHLPDDLGHFLQRSLAEDDPQLPVLIYNTWMTSYLRDKGQSMGYHIDQWAAGQKRPVLWLQWEPARDGSQAAPYGWCAWTADLWHDEMHDRWHFGWVHPHGTQATLGPELNAWRRFWQER